MGNIGDTMASGTVPPVGTAGTAYATQVNSFLTEVKGRLEAKVPLSSLQPGELNLLNNPVSNAQYVGLYGQTALPTLPIGSLQSFGDDLYWVSPSGAAKITTGSALNAAGIGGITGDYGGVNPAQLRFIDVDQTFYAYDDYGLGNWARVGGRSFDVYGSVAGTDRVRITWAGSTSYTLTLPAAVPTVATTMLQMDTSGNVLATNAIAIRPTQSYTDSFTVPCGPGFYTIPANVSRTTIDWTLCASVAGGAPAVQLILPAFGGMTLQSIQVCGSKTTAAASTITLGKYTASTLTTSTVQSWINVATGLGLVSYAVTTPTALAEGDYHYVVLNFVAVGDAYRHVRGLYTRS